MRERERVARGVSVRGWVSVRTDTWESVFFILRGWGKRLRSWMISFEVSQGV